MKNFFEKIFKKKPPIVLTPEMLNIDEFNKWFVDPNNGATNIANSKLFLHGTKISPYTIVMFLKNRYNVIDLTKNDKDAIITFYSSVVFNWIEACEQLNRKYILIEKDIISYNKILPRLSIY